MENIESNLEFSGRACLSAHNEVGYTKSDKAQAASVGQPQIRVGGFLRYTLSLFSVKLSSRLPSRLPGTVVDPWSPVDGTDVTPPSQICKIKC